MYRVLKKSMRITPYSSYTDAWVPEVLDFEILISFSLFFIVIINKTRDSIIDITKKSIFVDMNLMKV